jgi:hypothetical protein
MNAALKQKQQPQKSLKQPNELSSSKTKVVERQIKNQKEFLNTVSPALQRHNTKIVGPSRQSPYVRRPKPPVNLKNPPKRADNSQRIRISSPLKRTPTRSNLRKGVADINSRPPTKRLAQKSGSAMAGRVASSSRVSSSNSYDIHKRLKRKSPWFDSIDRPKQGAGVKIPDPCGTDTGTYQHVQTVTVSVNAQGVAGLRIISPYINNYTYGAPASDGSNYQTTGASASIADLQWNFGPYGPTAMPFANTPAKIKAVTKEHRVVSACVIAQPEISTLSDAGEMCAFVTPLRCNNAAVSYATYQMQHDSAMMPVNAHKPMKACWYPKQSDFTLFDTIQTQSEETPTSLSYADFVDPDPTWVDEALGVIPDEIGILCTGMTPSTGVVRFEMTVNYEFIPMSQDSFVDAQPSPIDDVEEQLVVGWVADTPMTSSISTHEAALPPATSEVSANNEPSGFGMLFNVIEEMAPLLKAGAAFL